MRIRILKIYLLVVISLVSIGVMIFSQNGWYWRLPKSVRFIQMQVDNPKLYHKINEGEVGFKSHAGWTYRYHNNPPDIILLGDSHVRMLQAGLVGFIAKRFKLSIYNSSSYSCLTLPGLTRLDKPTWGPAWDISCPENLSHALAYAKGNAAVIILSESWLEQIPLAGYLENHKSIGINTNSQNLTSYKSLTVGISKLKNAIGNHSLIIIGDVPGAGPLHYLRSCEERPFLSTNCSKNYILPETYNSKSIHINHVLRNFALTHDNVYFINPYNYFCKGSSCYSLSNTGVPFYSDQRHLSIEGSDFFISHVVFKILAIIQKSKMTHSIENKGSI